MARVGNLKKSLFDTLMVSRSRIKSEVNQTKMTKRVFSGLLDLLNLNSINRNPYITPEMKATINKLYTDGTVSVADKRAIVALCKSVQDECLWYAFLSWIAANGIRLAAPTENPLVNRMCTGAAIVLENWVVHPDVCHQAFINACYTFQTSDKLEHKPLYTNLLNHITSQIMSLFSDTFQKTSNLIDINTDTFVANNIYKRPMSSLTEGNEDDGGADSSSVCLDNDDDRNSMWSSTTTSTTSLSSQRLKRADSLLHTQSDDSDHEDENQLQLDDDYIDSKSVVDNDDETKDDTHRTPSTTPPPNNNDDDNDNDDHQVLQLGREFFTVHSPPPPPSSSEDQSKPANAHVEGGYSLLAPVAIYHENYSHPTIPSIAVDELFQDIIASKSPPPSANTTNTSLCVESVDDEQHYGGQSDRNIKKTVISSSPNDDDSGGRGPIDDCQRAATDDDPVKMPIEEGSTENIDQSLSNSGHAEAQKMSAAPTTNTDEPLSEIIAATDAHTADGNNENLSIEHESVYNEAASSPSSDSEDKIQQLFVSFLTNSHDNDNAGEELDDDDSVIYKTQPEGIDTILEARILQSERIV